ncbi:ribosome maturation factor RimP [Ruania halotolerans]|uniref:ribosome maturation factor RimP n=1 Tax=Ruania halotolerans TaxID=2897773 RepID=UPI001E5E0B59|nr:ribosome maturation factor RimP [Ruania halotolerans]UFU05186.1 ribosome maturation factor RimP [Ruania halotolerans]
MSPSPGPDALSAQVHDVLEPVVAGAGLYLEGVQISGAARRRVVRVTVDLPDGPGGVTSDSLGEVSHAVSARLDAAEDLLGGSYLLEVTTPGVSRPLTQPRHFRRAEGRLVTVATADDQVSGRVLGVSDDELTLATESGTVSLPLSDVVRGRIDVELNRAGDAQD